MRDVPNHDAVHVWFELSYSNYLVLPRSMLQSMPDAWQKKFITMVEELRETLDIDDAPSNYAVMVRGRDGKFTNDKYSNYDRGRRRIPHKAKP